MKTKMKRNIFMLIIMFSTILLPVFSQDSSTEILDINFTPMEDVKGLGKVICELRVPPSLVESFKQLLSGGTIQSDGSVIFKLQPPQDTITLNDKKDEAGNVIAGERTIAFRTRDFDVNNPNFFVDSVASYDISNENLKKTLLGNLASGDASFKFLAWKGTEDVAQSYKVTNATDMSFAVARITSVQPVTYINSDGVKVKTAALSGRLKVSTDVDFLARKKFRSNLSSQTSITSGKIVLDCKLIRCVLDKVRNIALINQAIENCSNILFNGGTVTTSQTEGGVIIPQCVCGEGQSLGLEGSISGEVTCCDTATVTMATSGSGVSVSICPATTSTTSNPGITSSSPTP